MIATLAVYLAVAMVLSLLSIPAEHFVRQWHATSRDIDAILATVQVHDD